jgi:hypothetical protein
MIQVQVVAPEQLYAIWDTIEPMLKASEESGPRDYSTEHQKMLIVSKLQTLLVAVEDDEICGVAVMQLDNYPNHRVATIASLGGKAVVSPEVFEQVVLWSKAQGATKIRAWAQEAQARLYRQKAGLNTTMYVVEKLI